VQRRAVRSQIGLGIGSPKSSVTVLVLEYRVLVDSSQPAVHFRSRRVTGTGDACESHYAPIVYYAASRLRASVESPAEATSPAFTQLFSFISLPFPTSFSERRPCVSISTRQPLPFVRSSSHSTLVHVLVRLQVFSEYPAIAVHPVTAGVTRLSDDYW